MITLLAYAAAGAGGAGLLHALVYLLIVLIVIAIVYYIGAAIIGKLGGEGIILTLWLCLCGVIALYFVISFLLTLAP